MFSFFILFSLFIFCSSQYINTDVNQSFDLSTSIVTISTKIEAELVKDVASSSVYTVLLLNEQSEHVAFFKAIVNKEEVEVIKSKSDKTFTYYDLILKKDEKKLSISLKLSLTDSLIPYPAEIYQTEKQFVLFSSSHYFASPYETSSQKSSYKLFSTNIQSHTELNPYSVKGNNILYGPYKNIEPFSVSPLEIHYYNHYPFARFNTCQREIEISHWGNVAFDEVIELEHTGAKLIGGFSRVDYQNHRKDSSSFRGLVANLPYEARNIYYRDQIGNISTSDLIYNNNKRTLEFGIQSRFPIFGGWKTQFYMGYSLPTELILVRDSENLDQLKLKVDFFTSFSSVWVEDMELKVILPEGSTDIKVNSPYPADINNSIRFTYLDSQLNGGRPVIVIKAKNLVPSHDKQIEITYNFKHNRIYVEPFMIVGSIFTFFFLLSIISFFRKSNKSDNKEKKE